MLCMDDSGKRHLGQSAGSAFESFPTIYAFRQTDRRAAPRAVQIGFTTIAGALWGTTGHQPLAA
jgi:hypothetical protein